MAYSTSQLRSYYGPACRDKGRRFLAAYSALDACLRHYSYRPRPGVTGAYNCRQITGGGGYSLHAYGPADEFTFWTGVTIDTALAVDINWDKNPYGPRLVTDMPRPMIDSIYKVRTNNGARVWGWGGYYSGSKDAMHFEIVCSPTQLGTGIDLRTLPQTTFTPSPTPDPYSDLEAMIMADPQGGARLVVKAFLGRGIKTQEELNFHAGELHRRGLNGYCVWLESTPEGTRFSTVMEAEKRTPDPS